MDLVDIDKVLDDFELNEDKNIQQISSINYNDERKLVQQDAYANNTTLSSSSSSLSYVTTTITNVQTINTTATTTTSTIDESATNAITNPTAINVNSAFVNVSNVFQSLNEYVNVEIQSNPTINLSSQLNVDDDNDKNEILLLQQKQFPTNISAATSGDSLLSSSVPSASEMLTESSSSTASSSATSSLSSSSSISLADNNAAIKTTTAVITAKTLTTTSTSSPSSSSSNDNEHPELIASSSSSIVERNDICLSSVSSYCLQRSSDNDDDDNDDGGDNRKNTVDNLLPSSSSSTSSSSSSSSTSISYTNELNLNDEMSSISKKQLIENNCAQKNVHLENDEQKPCANIQPENVSANVIVGFESTMDDVSDTELESYLQELELESTSVIDGGGATVVANTPSATYATTLINDDDDDDNNANVTLEKNMPNADSFSQASTIEYADIQLHSDFDQLPIIEQQNNVAITTANAPIIDDQRIIVDICCSGGDNEADEYEKPIQRPTLLEIPNPIVTAECLSEDISPSELAPKAPTTEQQQSAHLSHGSENERSIIEHHHQSSTDSMTITNSTQALTTPISTSPTTSIAPSIIGGVSGAIGDAGGAGAGAESDITIEQLGKIQPYWVPDKVTNFCMQCQLKFSLIKRRHHCRACGQVLCSNCCSLKAKLDYMGGDIEARICVQCDLLLNHTNANNNNNNNNNDDSMMELQHGDDQIISDQSTDSSIIVGGAASANNGNTLHPNPNNPMEYCSVIPPLQQIAQLHQQNQQQNAQISVMVPVGVLKREGSSSNKNRKEKMVIFSDGIRPGCDLTDLDTNWDNNVVVGSSSSGGGGDKIGGTNEPVTASISITNDTNKNVRTTTNPPSIINRLMNKKLKLPKIDESNQSFIPPTTNNDHQLPPILTIKNCTDYHYVDVENNEQLIQQLQREQLKFAIQRNFYVLVKIVKLTCCINKTVINFTTQGMHHVGQDEIIILLELAETNALPKDIFLHLNDIYRNADKGTTISELGFSMPSVSTLSTSFSSTDINNCPTFLGSKEHGGFLYIRSTFQCLQNIIVPENPYLIGILIHRWEVPWAKIFPLRLMLRLGALYRYYPCPHVSVCNRDSAYAEIAQTIINCLADFRKFSYTLPTIRGMFIHMEDRTTSVLIPKNRYEQIMKAMNNSSEHILALGGNFSQTADGHLVCIQNIDIGCTEIHSYSTQAVNIQGRPRKITGASFLVLNGALKSTSGLSGKCSIVEDGLMIQILPNKMISIRKSLKDMKDIEIICGPIDGNATQTESVCIRWVADDTEFNIGVLSPIDNRSMAGISSIRVHRGIEFTNSNHILRWTEVFIIQSDEDSSHVKDPIDLSKLSETIARSAATALITYLDLLAASDLKKIALRTTLHMDNVCYEIGSKNTKLGPLYMNSLDNELIPMLHRQATNLQLETPIIIELIFHILDE